MTVSTAPRSSTTGPPREVNGPVAVAVLIYLGLSLQLLQVGIIPLLASIGESVHTSPTTTSWLLTGGLLSGAVLLGLLSRLADLIGKKPVIVLALALVLVGSLIGCFADSFGTLLIGRILMGALLPMLALPESLASDTMSPQRAQQTIGAIHAGTGVGIGLGLLLGALAAGDGSSWRIYFVIGAVTSAVGIVAVLTLVHDSPARAPGRLDGPGAVLLAAGLTGVLLAIAEGSTWHWSSGRVLGCLAGGVALLVVWWFVESRTRYPLFSVQQLLHPAVRWPYAITFLAAMGIYSALSALTRLAQTPTQAGAGFGWSPHSVAWYGLPTVIGSLLGLTIMRPLLKRGRRVTALVVGVSALILTFVILGPFVAHASATLIAAGIDSVGLTLTLALAQIIVLRNVRAADSGIAVGLTIVLYAVGNSVGNAATASLFAAHSGPSGAPTFVAYRLAFLVSGLAALLALGLCGLLARRREDAAPDAAADPTPVPAAAR
ncbi:MFS transporter [uncultured Jatrophihabitans sp.]|uniref:MFS transporter n=1 Tax=uncultured Jatrophihabitans sp. TaxID=1610747 RepID=UPI0035CAD663